MDIVLLFYSDRSFGFVGKLRENILTNLPLVGLYGPTAD